MGVSRRCYTLASAVAFWWACADAHGDPSRTTLPLGDPLLPQSVQADILAPGVVHYRYRRGIPGLPNWQLASGVVASGGDAQRVRACFDALRIAATPASFRLGDGPQGSYTVYGGGRRLTQQDALDLEQRAAALHCPLFVRRASDDPANHAGPWTVDLLVVDLRRRSCAPTC
jgi:hypothetical protein